VEVGEGVGNRNHLPAMIFGFTLQDKFGIFIAAIIALIIAGMSLFFFSQLTDSLMNSLRTDLVDMAQILAKNIDANSIPRILAGSERSKPYWDLKKYLKGIQLQNNKIKSIYVMVKTAKPNIWKFVADEDQNPKTMAHLNEEYDVSGYPQMKMAFGGPVADQETSSDKWGRWLSGYAPIYDRDGHPVAIVGIDISAGDVDSLRRNVLNTVVICFAIGLALAIIFGRIGAITITGPVTALLKGVRNIEEGRYGYKIDVHRRDEIGDLVAGFNRMSDKLGEVDKLKSDFMSVISHELYTPLTPLKDAAAMLKADPQLPPESRALVDIMDRQTNRMQNLVDEILDFSWLEIKEWKLDLEPVNPKLLAKEVFLEMMERSAKKKIKLTEKVSEHLPTVRMDKKRIQHVLKILIDNAVKFSPEESEVLLTVDRVGGGVEFAVADQGLGLKPQDIDAIFQSFHQVEDHMTRIRGGMGLGLAIAKRIIEAHNGTIWAESAGLGEGSRFIFLLPMG